jgi:tetratricopeptide (TPR) repeat protein
VAEFVNLYKVLDIGQDASDEQIRAAIKTQRKLWNSRQQNRDKEIEREAEDQLARVRSAEKTLLDPAGRANHDAQIAAYVPPAPERQPNSDPDGRDWVAEAVEHLRENRPEAAAGAAREATDREGSNHAAWVLRGRASLRLNQADNAIFEFGEAVRLKPTSDEYHCDLGSAYESKRNYDKALDSYRRAQRLAPAVRQYPLRIASVYLEDGKAEQAVELLVPLQAAQPDDQMCNYFLAYALNDYTLKTWTAVETLRVITTREQVSVTKRNITRAQELTFDDDELRRELLLNLGEALAAEKSTYRLPGRQLSREMDAGGGCVLAIGYFIAFCTLMGLLASDPLVGLPLLVAAGYGWYRLAYKPQWKRNAADPTTAAIATGERRLRAR